MTKRALILGCALAHLVLLPAAAQAAEAAAAPRPAAPAPPVRNFLPVKDGIWRVSNGGAWALVYVTDDGILLADTINPDFGTWLKGELAKRFPGKPVRYVVYSHSHFDHVEGARLFPEALVVAHAQVLENMDGRFPHMPGGFYDSDADGKFDVTEVRDRTTYPTLGGYCGSNFFNRLDLDHDGKVTPAEYHSDIRRPDIVYSERMTLTLGGKRIELLHPGKNHANDGTVLYFPAEKVVFSTDFPADALVRTSMRSLPSACGNFDRHPLSEWIKSYRSIEALDFDTLVQGHGQVTFKKEDVAEGRKYFEDLRDAVKAGMAKGMGLQALKANIKLEQYKDWAFYKQLLEDNIESAYYNLQIYR